jgi:hypothetical protein
MGHKGPIKLKDIDRAGSVVENFKSMNDERLLYDFSDYKNKTLKKTIEKYGKGNILDAVFNMEAKIASLKVEVEVLDELIDWESMEGDDFEEDDEEFEEEEDDDNV